MKWDPFGMAINRDHLGLNLVPVIGEQATIIVEVVHQSHSVCF